MDNIMNSPKYESVFPNKLGKGIDHTTNAKIPYYPSDPLKVFVSGFGNTLKSLNNEEKKYSGFDWYYKGHGNGLIVNGGDLILPFYGQWGGFESELIMVHLINEKLKPVYLGYTVGLDFTNTGLRRLYPEFKTLSHLSQTVISQNICINDFPSNDQLITKVIRNSDEIINIECNAGFDNMWLKPEKMVNYLTRNHEILEPGMIFYTLTGATMSSDKLGVKLKDNDKIFVHCNKTGISVQSTFKERSKF